MELSDLEISDVINFETVIGERRTNFKYKGSVPWDIAKSLGLDVVSKHIQYAIEMPPGSPTDFKNYPYAIFQRPDGTQELYGHPWIKQRTIELKDTVSYQMHIPSATDQQLDSLRSFCTAIGLMGFKIDPL